MTVFEMPDGSRITWEPAPDAPPHPPPPNNSITLALGPHLFLDNYLVESTDTNRWPLYPVRSRPTPILSAVDGFYSGRSVIRTAFGVTWAYYLDKVNGVLHPWRRVSADGTIFGAPVAVTGFPPGLAPSHILFDNGVYWTVEQHVSDPPYLWRADLYSSVDGLAWEFVSTLTEQGWGETWSMYRDAGAYHLLHRHNLTEFTWIDKAGISHTPVFTRTFAHTASPIQGGLYPASEPVFIPDSLDAGETQFYSVSNIIQRGELYLGMLNIYREDIVVSGAPAGSFGQGYTVLIYSRDGIYWTRERSYYFQPEPASTAWDHAIAWISDIVPVGDNVRLYYHGSKFGHLGTDRGLGLMAIRRDRYMGRIAPTTAPKILRTKPIKFNAQALTVNSYGTVRVQITDAATGSVLPGFSYAECQTITGDNLDKYLLPAAPLIALAGRSIVIEFEVSNGGLFGFSLY